MVNDISNFGILVGRVIGNHPSWPGDFILAMAEITKEMKFNPLRVFLFLSPLYWDKVEKSQNQQHIYPYIAEGYGVWVNEINGQDLSIVMLGPACGRMMTTERARELCGE